MIILETTRICIVYISYFYAWVPLMDMLEGVLVGLVVVVVLGWFALIRNKQKIAGVLSGENK